MNGFKQVVKGIPSLGKQNVSERIQQVVKWILKLGKRNVSERDSTSC